MEHDNGRDEEDGTSTGSCGIPIISNDEELLRRGICRVKLPCDDTWNIQEWAETWSQVTPEILTAQGDGEYAFYRNLMEESEFPFTSDNVFGASGIGTAFVKYFSVQNPQEELRLDDAFCVSYNMDQDDTTGAKHMDPSDITVNMCLYKAEDTKGSHVLFYGTKELSSLSSSSSSPTTSLESPQFLVPQEPGYATIHFGDHPHETTRLENGKRTNVILTYCYSDPSRSQALTRTCY